MSSLLSIDIGSAALHMVEGAVNKGSISVEKSMTFPIPDGCLLNEIIKNQTLLSETLNEALKIFNPSAKEVVITYNGINSVVRDIDLPTSKPKELDEMIKNELVQLYNILASDIVQYKPIENFTNDSGDKMTKNRAVAVDREFIDDYHTLLMGTKLKPVAMDINLNAIDKLLTGSDIVINDKILDGNTIMLLDFGKTSMTIYILSQGKPLFHRHINVGSGEIERRIQDETFTTEKEIRTMKEQGYNFFSEEEAAKKYFAILRPIFYNLLDEIRKIIGFYSSRNAVGNGNIDQIYLFGGGSNLKGFVDYIESNFNIPTEKVVSISKVKFKETEASIGNYLNAIGALIRN